MNEAMDWNAGPTFPPLMQGERVALGGDPMETAQARAVLGCEAGTVCHCIQSDRLRAAVVLAPEVPLVDAMAMFPLATVAFQNALGALAPPEVAVQFSWSGGILVNGARCGRVSAAASNSDPQEIPGWLIVALDLALRSRGESPGVVPDRTALWEEGCGDVSPVNLLESWTRHMLAWISRWTEQGNEPLHREWIALVQGVGEVIEIAGQHGTFLGVDEQFGMLLRSDDGTRLIPLTRVLESG